MVIDNGKWSRGMLLSLVAVTLVAVALLILASGVSAVFTYSGVAIRDRIYFGAERGAGVFPVALGLAAVLISIWCASLADVDVRLLSWTRAAAMAIAVVVIGAALFSIWYVLSLHVSIPGPNSSASVGFSIGEHAWSEKLTQILQRAAALLMSAVTLVAIRGTGPGMLSGAHDARRAV